MPLYNLLEYSSNYSDKTGNFWFYSKDKAAKNNNAIAADDDNFKSLKYNTKLIGNTVAPNGILEDAITVLLKYLRTFFTLNYL